MFESVAVLPDHLLDRPSRWFVFDRNKLMLVDGAIPTGAGCPGAGAGGPESEHVLGHDGETPYRAARVGADFAPPMDADMVDLRQAFAILDEADWVMAGRAQQILGWEHDHRFCGRCGSATERHTSERSMSCPGCGMMSFPRLTPAIITLVEREDGRALLAWGRQFPGRFFSALAGFVEPGESLEETVEREIKEEVGIGVSDIRYFGSQPWPFPHSLMIGFQARYLHGDLKLQESEIVEADWFHAHELPPVPKGRMSIAGWLIEDWLSRAGAR